ncbi:unnamed protein product, partial [Sphacelaria rigidula]
SSLLFLYSASCLLLLIFYIPCSYAILFCSTPVFPVIVHLHPLSISFCFQVFHLLSPVIFVVPFLFSSFIPCFAFVFDPIHYISRQLPRSWQADDIWGFRKDWT